MPAPLHPAFAPYADLARALDLASGPPSTDALNACARDLGTTNAHGTPLTFVAPDTRLAARDYERRVLDTGAVSTRPDNWHDALNALVWLRFPRLKAALNAAHVDAMAGETGPLRQRRRDALTLLDESGLLLTSRDPACADLLAAHEWETLFVERRAEVEAGMDFTVVGHALLEKALAPFPGVTAKCLALPYGGDLEAAAVSALPGLAGPRQLLPLPIAGIPGWDAGNADPSFYTDRKVFRPKRS